VAVPIYHITLKRLLPVLVTLSGLETLIIKKICLLN